jgi:FkbM family methyltransferase
MNRLQKIFSLLPQFKGKLRLARLVFQNKEKPRTFKSRTNIYYSLPNLIENVSFELFVNGNYEKEIVDFICSSLPKNGCFIDAGANIGAICLEIAYRRPDIQVFAFEASPSVYAYLEVNKKMNNLDNLWIYNLAIHDIGGLQLPFYSPEKLNGKGSFAPVFTKDSVMVTTINLDEFFLKNNIKPDLIKIDVEGFELLILKSTANYLKDSNSCMILFEFADWAETAAGFEIASAQNYLLSMGYNLYKLPSKVLLNSPINKGFEMLLATKKIN